MAELLMTLQIFLAHLKGGGRNRSQTFSGVTGPKGIKYAQHSGRSLALHKFFFQICSSLSKTGRLKCDLSRKLGVKFRTVLPPY